MLYLDPSDHAQAEAQDQRCTWVKEKVSSKFELRSCSQIVARAVTVATSIALTLALVLPVLKVLTLAVDSSCRSFFFLYN